MESLLKIGGAGSGWFPARWWCCGGVVGARSAECGREVRVRIPSAAMFRKITDCHACEIDAGRGGG